MAAATTEEREAQERKRKKTCLVFASRPALFFCSFFSALLNSGMQSNRERKRSEVRRLAMLAVSSDKDKTKRCLQRFFHYRVFSFLSPSALLASLPSRSPLPQFASHFAGKGEGTHEAARAVAAPRGGVCVLCSSSASAMSRNGREADAAGATMGRQGRTTDERTSERTTTRKEKLLAKR